MTHLFVLHLNFDLFVAVQGFNFCDTMALSAHVFVMFAGSMYQSGRLSEGLASSYAYIFIAVNFAVGSYLLIVATNEVKQSLPLIDMLFSTHFWLEKVLPYVSSTLKYRLFWDGSKEKAHLRSVHAIVEYFHEHDEHQFRKRLVKSLEKNPLLSFRGRETAVAWLNDENTSMRDGFIFVKFMKKMKADINRSLFDYLVSSPLEENLFSGSLRYFGLSLHIMCKHYLNNTRLISSYGIGRSLCSLDNHRKFVSIGCVEVEKLLEPFVLATRRQSVNGLSHGCYDDLAYRPYVDSGDGVCRLCFINSIVSLSQIDVTFCPSDRYKPAVPRRIVSVRELRVYCCVKLRKFDGTFWPGEIVEVNMNDGSFVVRDPVNGVCEGARAIDLSPLQKTSDHPVGYLWCVLLVFCLSQHCFSACSNTYLYFYVLFFVILI
jgi:hypothetical protein